MKNNRGSKVYLSLFFTILYIPILAVLIFSFNASASTASWTGFSLTWYKELFNDRVIMESLILSLQVGVLTAVFSAVVGTYAAVISLFQTKRRGKTIEGMMFLPLLVPELALGISLLILFTFLNVPLGRLTLIIAHSLFTVPYVYIMVRLRLQEIDRSILEASRDLGATKWEMVKTIVLPLVYPAILTASLLSLAMSLDDVVISTYVSGTQSTLPVHVFSMMRVGVTPKINALCTAILLMTFTILGLAQIDFKKDKKREVK
ncbi:ABC transporter permease [Erysipelothrix urinaevulpis]|uniref:ABC transporter permease n=1 Tax=Erysipelothrix urinaevulpis TaxID=2683717 RepID=UPI0013576FDA|nr:ABC transporter permease [Erysipelothrix urinaevulpis]